MVWLIGYVFGKCMGLGEDLLGGVVIEWGVWVGMQCYFFDDFMFGVIECFNCVMYFVFVYGFDDDLWVMFVVINVLIMYFMNMWVECWQIVFVQVGGVVGYMGFFCLQFVVMLWLGLVDWLCECVVVICNEVEVV